MKFIYIFLIAISSLMVEPTLALATNLQSAHYDSAKKEIHVTVQYGGGCVNHSFELEVHPICLESHPIMQKAKVVDKTPKSDPCKGIMTQELVFPLKNYKICPGKVTLRIEGEPGNSLEVPLPDSR